MEIVLATCNLHKIREYRDMFKSLAHVELLSLHSFTDYTVPEESFDTFQDNALVKAQHAAKHLNRWVIADDSGLVVPALQGEPGIRSRRYAGSQATDEENRNKLLEAMRHLKEQERTAYFECCIAIVNPNSLHMCFSGICEGSIAKSPRGNNGFGYDSLFVKTDYEKTFGQLTDTVKNRISHRYKAFQRLGTFLETQKNLKR